MTAMLARRMTAVAWVLLLIAISVAVWLAGSGRGFAGVLVLATLSAAYHAALSAYLVPELELVEQQLTASRRRCTWLGQETAELRDELATLELVTLELAKARPPRDHLHKVSP